jgi:ATP-dependent RNA helicase DDX27
MEVKKGENMIEHEAEIYSRPARTWFQTGKEKANAEGCLFIASDNNLTANHFICLKKQSASSSMKMDSWPVPRPKAKDPWMETRQENASPIGSCLIYISCSQREINSRVSPEERNVER